MGEGRGEWKSSRHPSTGYTVGENRRLYGYRGDGGSRSTEQHVQMARRGAETSTYTEDALDSF